VKELHHRLIGLGADEAVLLMVRNSLESIALCAGDPLCAEHSLNQEMAKLFMQLRVTPVFCAPETFC
jgi:hypothetical protein